jgi:hypothetical protein
MNGHMRHQILAVLERLCRKYPSMRFGQLVSFIAIPAKGPIASAVPEVEDADFLAAAEEHLKKRSSKP